MILRRWRIVALLLAGGVGCTRSEAQTDRLPERMTPGFPVGRAVDSTHRVVCYVFPNGSGDCQKF